MPAKHYQSYMICTSPRSGSTLLCELLARTEIAGSPSSLFHKPSLSVWLDSYGLSNEKFEDEKQALSVVFDAAMVKGKGDTDIFGLRMQRESFGFFMEQLKVLYPELEGDFERIAAAFGSTLFIHLSRTNKLDQSISLIKAKQTGLWHLAADGTELQRLSPPQEPVYDGEEIAKQISALSAMDEEWIQWFETQGIAPLRISYDQLSEDPIAITRTIIETLGLQVDEATNLDVPVAKLADATNAAWAKRFTREQRR